MYSDDDIDGAVAAGALDAGSAAAFRAHVATTRAAPVADEEQFRLLTGFNDIFVTIAILLLLGAVWQIGASFAGVFGGLLVAAVAWGLAEYFTARRRMALPSIVLLLAFVGGIAGGGAALLVDLTLGTTVAALGMAGIAAVSAGAAWLHWRRFMVPITVAAGAVAVVGTIVSLGAAAVPQLTNAVWPLLFVGGLGVFAVAMWWDMSDPTRRTRRSDVAFWLHLAAAPMIAHPVFRLLGVFDGQIGVATALAVIALYLAFAYVALAVDRRALLVSSLFYVLYAMYALFRSAGALGLSAALTALVIGSALLTLSAFWQAARRPVIRSLGNLARRLPPVSG